VTLTEPETGIGVWIRYTVLAPRSDSPSCSLWLLAMDPAAGVTARKRTFPIEELSADAEPFRLQIGDATLESGGAEGEFDDVRWSLRWAGGRGYDHVRPGLRRFATTVLTLPQGDVGISGEIRLGSRSLQLDRVRGAQAHLWGRAHAERWAWARCGDFRDQEGEPVPDTFVDGVAVHLRRAGREIGPLTPIVGRIAGEDFHSTSPLRVLRNRATLGLTRWRFEAAAGSRKLIGEVEAEARLLAGVAYREPDDRPAYCYNTETGSMRLDVYRRQALGRGWCREQTLIGRGRAHFEYGQRQPVPGVELVLR
jgi:hypothetical protein